MSFNSNVLNKYKLISSNYIDELRGTMSILVHQKTNAKLCVIENSDDNKVFSVSFRTPPKDSSGVAHIIEHSVLCGSDKYPIKDPFVELAKGSLCNFVNAMTYPDKTMYPIASCNLQDYKNATSVYCDAVFHPSILHNPYTFMQEGWHYEVNNNDELTINGVVYNEMKGAFSNPEDCLFERIMQHLYPDTSYGVVSGGDPDAIPNLTYEQFINFHQTYYHPSNSYIYFYGDCDMNERLLWLDQEVLSDFDAIEVDSALEYQQTFEQLKEVSLPYSIDENESSDDKTYLSLTYGLDLPRSNEFLIAFKVLSYVLVNGPAALLRKALIDKGIGQDFFGGFQDGIAQPMFLMISKNANQNQQTAFISTIRQTLLDVVTNGLNKQDCHGALNALQFNALENTSLPKGLLMNLSVLDAWLYDSDPYTYVHYMDGYDQVSQWIDQGKLEELIKQYILDSNFAVSLMFYPEKGYAKKQEELLKEQLAYIKQQLSEEQLNKIKDDAATLKQLQSQTNSEEALKTLPMLSIADLDKKMKEYPIEEFTVNGLNGLKTVTDLCNGIIYLDYLFDCSSLNNEQIFYASLLMKLMGKLDTSKYSYDRLDTHVLTSSGGYAFGSDIFAKKDQPIQPMVYGSIKVLQQHIGFGLNILMHVLTETQFDNTSRLIQVIDELVSSSQMDMIESSHSVIAQRINGYFNPSSKYMDSVGGIDFYQKLCVLQKQLHNNDKEALANLVCQLQHLQDELFTLDHLTLHYIADQSNDKAVLDVMKSIKFIFNPNSSLNGCFKFNESIDNEAFTTNGMVNYVAQTGTFDISKANLGALLVLKNVLNYGYLWENIRVKGGAYGVFNIVNRKGLYTLVTYRDPNVANSYDVFDGLSNYVTSLELSNDDLVKNIIGTISGMDYPMGAKEFGATCLRYYLNGITHQQLQHDRNQVLACSVSDLQQCSSYIKEALNKHAIGVIGNNTNIEENKNLFKSITKLV